MILVKLPHGLEIAFDHTCKMIMVNNWSSSKVVIPSCYFTPQKVMWLAFYFTANIAKYYTEQYESFNWSTNQTNNLLTDESVT